MGRRHGRLWRRLEWNFLRGAGIFALLTIFIGFTPLLMAIVYVMRPTERNLALMRPASLAGIFGALCGVVGGLIVILRAIGVNAAPIADVYPKVASDSRKRSSPCSSASAALLSRGSWSRWGCGGNLLDGFHDPPRRDAVAIEQLVGLAATRNLADRQPLHGESRRRNRFAHRVADAPAGE